MENLYTIDLTIDSMAQGGDGVGRHEGMVVFARGGLPGERVRVALAERRPNFLRGPVVEVLEPAPERVAPRVAADGHAPWQHIDYAAQLRFKERILREQLAKLAGIVDPPLAPMIAAPQPWGYRNSARLHVADARIGYHAAGTREVIELAEDPLLLPALNEALAGLRPLLAPDLVHGVMLRASAAYGYGVAALDPQAGVGSKLEALADVWLSAVPTLAGVVVAGQGGHNEGAGVQTLHDELAGVVFDLGPDSFFQVHAAQAARMIELVRAGLQLEPGGRLLDVYSGVGTFALPLAAELGEVIAVEEHPAAVTDGERSAALNNLTNVRFIQAPAERAMLALDGPFNGVVLDPPRRGCHPTVLDELIALMPPRIAYISCHPGILGRDLVPLLGAGYHLELVQPIDLFPQTPHIEAVVILARR